MSINRNEDITGKCSEEELWNKGVQKPEIVLY